MTFLERSRNFIFWSFDLVKTNKVSTHYKEVKFINENPTHKKAINKRKTNVFDLLTHAKATTTFYSNVEGDAIEDFPVIDKQIILDQYDDFLSSSFNVKDVVKSCTTGSTGIPFTFYRDDNKISRNTADTIYFSELAHYNVGTKLIYVRLWVEKYMKSKFVFFAQNIIPHSILKNSKSEIIDFLLMLKRTKAKKTLIAYPSFLEEICRFLELSDDYDAKDTNIRSIITTSEKLNSFEKERALYYFKAPIYERYSNTENGIIAQNTIRHKTNFQINHASFYLEVLDVNTNAHVKDGEVGKIVITDLYNYAMPFIRYDTGDLATYKVIENEYPVMSNVYGRRMDIVYSTAGKILSPHLFYHIADFSKLKQYQFIQNTKTSYTFKLNAKKEDTQELDMINYFKQYLGDDATFTFDYAQDIMHLDSGKRKKVLNLMS